MLVMCFFLPTHPTLAQTQETIVDRLDKVLGVKLPTEYRQQFIEFVNTNKIMKDEGSNKFTEQFIKEQMKNNWGISKQNQLLFVWQAIHNQITDQFIYKGDDNNEARLEEFGNVMERYDECGKKFKSSYIAYTKQRSEEAIQRSEEAKQRSEEAKQRSEEAKQRSEEAKQRSEEAKRQTAEYERQSEEAKRQTAEYERQSEEAKQRSAEAIQTTILVDYYGLAELIKYYLLPHNEWDPEEEVKAVKEAGKKVAQNLEKYNIDYRSLLPVEVQQYIGLQQTGSQRTNLTCEQAIRNLYTICLQELNKAYQLYQKAPQVDRTEEKQRAKEYIFENCKKFNIDYKTILTPEARQFYGVE